MGSPELLLAKKHIYAPSSTGSRLRGAEPSHARAPSRPKALHITLSHKPPQHRGLPRPEGASSR